MTFSGDLQKFSRKIETLTNDVFVGVVEECERSIVSGSEITSAPGQPVGQYGVGYNQGAVGGFLKGSWQRWFTSPTEAHIATSAVYAPSIEDGVSYAHGGTDMNLRSSVGGFHSVKMTIAGFQRIVDYVVRKQGGVSNRSVTENVGKDYSGSMPSGFSGGGSA